jgi:hypothetical protein
MEVWKSPHLGAGPGLVKLKGNAYICIFMNGSHFIKAENYLVIIDDILFNRYMVSKDIPKHRR